MGAKMDCKECPLNNGNYCYKIGGNISVIGCCEDDIYKKEKLHSNPSKLNKYERNKKYKHKLKRIANNPRRYPAGAYYVVDKGCHWSLHQDYYDWIHENGKYVKRCYRPSYSGWLKKQASKKFRRYNGELANGCAYKKIFDYWWELT